MPDFPDWNDLFRIGRDELLARNAHISRDVAEREGTDTNAILASQTSIGDEVVGQLVVSEAGLFLDSATGTVLDRLVFDRYGILRKSAAPALGQVQLTTSAPTVAAFTIPAGTIFSTAEGVQFLSISDVTFPVASTGPVTVNVRSALAGANQQAQAGTITSIVSQITGQPTDLVASNPDATAGADDDETDESLRARARQFFATARRGTRAAIEQGGLAVPGVRTASAIEVNDFGGLPARVVELIITDSFTEVLVGYTPTPATYATQSSLFAQTVFNALDDVRAAGIYVNVRMAVVVLQPVRLSLSFQAGADTELAGAQARAAVTAIINNLAPGVTLRVTDLIAALRLVRGLIVTGFEVTAPAGDVVPQTLEVIRTSLNLVTLA